MRALGRSLLGSAAGAIAAIGVSAAEFAAPIETCAPGKAVEGRPTRCVAADGTANFRLSGTHATQLGTIESFAALTSQSADAFTTDRLIAGDRRRLGHAHQVMITGMTARLLDDRLTLTTQMGLSQTQDNSSGWADKRDGSARMVRLETKLADNDLLRWSLAGEMSDVDDDFFIGQAFADGARLALPGRRLALSSTLNWQRARLTASVDDYQGRFGTLASGRVGISRNGVSLSLRSVRSTFDTGQGDSLARSMSSNQTATLELDLTALAPALAMDERFPAALIPRQAMIAVRRGDSESRFAGTVERFERRGIELDSTWETPIGETSLGYWRDQRLGATAHLGRRDEQMVQVSHMVRVGGWRFGVDASVAANRSTRDSGLDDRNVAFGGSVAYEASNGPRLMIQLSQDRGRAESDDLSFLTVNRGQQVNASLDLTDLLRQRFERDDLRLKVDYRRQLDRSTTAVSSYEQLVDEWTDGYGGQGVLVSFGMKL